MPDLPTLTLSQAHFDRVVAAFPGTTMAQKAMAYKAWLTNHLISQVEQSEQSRIAQELLEQRLAAEQAVRDSLPPRQPYPPTFD